MTSITVEKLASKFSLSKEELIRKGIKAFLLNQLHLFEAERRKIFSAHAVHTIEEFDQLLADHPDDESDLLEHFQRADYLTHRIEEITQWIKELNG